MTTSSIAQRLIGNTDEFPGVVRFCRKHRKVLCGGVKVGATAHNMA